MLKDIWGRRLVFLDGAMGSMLQKSGMPDGALPETMNIAQPEKVIDIHAQYLEAGSDVISANTFGAYSFKFANLEEIVAAAMENAKTAIARGGYKNKWVAFDMAPTGKMMEPYGDASFEEIYGLYAQNARLAEKHGADLIILETMMDLYEAKAAILAVKENTNLPVIASVTYENSGRTLTGASPLEQVSILQSLGVEALGVNCGFGPDLAGTVLDKLLKYSDIPVFIQPNAGLPAVENGENVYKLEPLEFARYMAEFARRGAWLLGGCCGTTPAHIRKMVELCRDIVPPAIKPKNLTTASSWRDTVIFAQNPVIIGECINPANKPDLAQAVKDRDWYEVADLAMEQKDEGAQALDVNISLPGEEEEGALAQCVKALQETVSLPLILDSPNPSAFKEALRIYNGRPVINSVTGEQKSMEILFPLAKKYGALCICLAMDEKGVSQCAGERVEIARKMIDTAAGYGIAKKDLIMDTLVLPVVGVDNAFEAITALRRVKEELGIATVLGISNVSYGLPGRDAVNAAFLSAALYAGLDAAIVNPFSERIKEAVSAHKLLTGQYVNLDGSLMN